MPKICYTPRTFSTGSKKLIDLCNDIIEEYQGEGYDLTLRQLYYQLVSRDVIPNRQTEYKRLGSILNDARLAGLVDWEAIVDRTRELRGLSHWNSPQEILQGAASGYRTAKWKNQRYRVEVWIEKDALVGVVERACHELDVDFFSCRGYTSQSEMWEAAQRHLRHERTGKEVIILHLGDHDPSGIDMTRDIQDRLNLFHASTVVHRIALNKDQIDLYEPPPNPAKLTDSRISGYLDAHGEESWELDALEPTVLYALIQEWVRKYRNEDQWDQDVEKEQEDKDVLWTVSRRFEYIKRVFRENLEGDDEDYDEDYEADPDDEN